MMICVIALLGTGSSALSKKRNAEWSTATIKNFKLLHKGIAYFFLAVSFVALSSGLWAYARIRGSEWEKLGLINFIIMLIIAIGCEVNFIRQRDY